jgi:hypothetical protein
MDTQMDINEDIPKIYSEDIFCTKIFSCLSCLIPSNPAIWAYESKYLSCYILHLSYYILLIYLQHIPIFIQVYYPSISVPFIPLFSILVVHLLNDSVYPLYPFIYPTVIRSVSRLIRLVVACCLIGPVLLSNRVSNCSFISPPPGAATAAPVQDQKRRIPWS